MVPTCNFPCSSYNFAWIIGKISELITKWLGIKVGRGENSACWIGSVGHVFLFAINSFAVVRTMGKTMFLGVRLFAFGQSSFLAIVYSLIAIVRNVQKLIFRSVFRKMTGGKT